MSDEQKPNFKPAKKGMKLEHPIDGVLADEGGVWREDQFTLRRLRDGDIKRIEPDADKSDDKLDAPKLQIGKGA